MDYRGAPYLLLINLRMIRTKERIYIVSEESPDIRKTRLKFNNVSGDCTEGKVKLLLQGF